MNQFKIFLLSFMLSVFCSPKISPFLKTMHGAINARQAVDVSLPWKSIQNPIVHKISCLRLSDVPPQRRKGQNPPSLSQAEPNSKAFSDWNLLNANGMSFIDSKHNLFPLYFPPSGAVLGCFQRYSTFSHWNNFNWRMCVPETERGTVGSLVVRTTSSTASESSRSSQLSSCLQEWNSAFNAHPHNRGRVCPSPPPDGNFQAPL